MAGRISAQTVLYESQPDFPDFVTGNLARQDGWLSASSYSTNAAQIVSYSAGHALEIFGPFVAESGTDFYSGAFIHPLSNYDAVSAGTPIVSVSADMWMNLGPTAGYAGFLCGSFGLNDQNGNAYFLINIDKNGQVIGGPGVATNTATNTFHVLRADYNFATRTVTFYMDNSYFGSTPFSPYASNLVGSVEVSVDSSNPIDSNLLLDNLSVTAGTTIPTGGCSLQITAPTGPCLPNSVAGTPNVGDLYGLKVTFNITGTLNRLVRGQPSRPLGHVLVGF
ncbi:MAG TPA: hypothetical protein VH619_06085 [Verrucomicrobiae bacterium]|nr:hypothetical protein [Verrucomicrobiae bacterium]